MKQSPDISTDKDLESAETSEYLGSGNAPISLGFNALASDHFTNIQKIYDSPTNPTEMFSAIRYGKRYILKGINKNFRDDQIQALALSKEFEIGISLDHPNIRQTIGFEEVEGLGKVIILEYFDGESLKDYLSSKTVTPYQARSIARQIASALKYIHSKQIIHRDLKPSNILISHHGLYVKIIDFNLSDSESFIILKNPAGSKKYMAPEQIESSAQSSIVTDIYSFGVIVRELAQAANDPLLINVADRCTDADPRKRPQSVDEIKLPRPEADATTVSRLLSSKITTYLFSIICLLLSVFIFYLARSKNLI